MRAIFASFVLALVAVVGYATPATADYCGASANGCARSLASTDCAGHGAFGAFGTNGDVTHDFRGGASGDKTAYNNSTLCGSPQGAAGQIGQ